MGLGSTMCKQAAECYKQSVTETDLKIYTPENACISSSNVHSSTRSRLALFKRLNSNNEKHKDINYTKRENPEAVLYRKSITTASIIM